MRYLIFTIFLISSNIFAMELVVDGTSNSVNCLNIEKKPMHFNHSRSKNFPKSASKNHNINCFESSKNIVKNPNVISPSKKVSMGAAVILNPVAAAYWLIDKAVKTGVDKTVNR